MTHIGLISDTHMPRRWPSLPPGIFDIFADVDLIVHAGDVGEWWVRDQLSDIAPVVAVHGNDETAAATAALPFLHTLAIDGQRMTITHGHMQDPAAERGQRQNDRWQPKLTQLAETARQHGASIMVMGHMHIPFATAHDDVLVINPGAIASSGLLQRQIVQTVARLLLQPDTPPQVQHYEVHNQQPYQPQIDWEAGFKAALTQFAATIAAPDLLAEYDWLLREVYRLDPEYCERSILPLSHECWAGQRDFISLADLTQAVSNGAEPPPAIIAKLRESPTLSQYL
jgi:putative phosphoesterase